MAGQDFGVWETIKDVTKVVSLTKMIVNQLDVSKRLNTCILYLSVDLLLSHTKRFNMWALPFERDLS